MTRGQWPLKTGNLDSDLVCSGDAPYQVSASATNVFYISLHSTMLNGLKLKVTLLDPLTGRKVDQYSLGSESELSTTETIIFVGANSACPLLAWTDKAHKTLKINIIGNKHVASFPIGSTSSDIQNVTLHAPHRTTAVPHFLIHYQNSKEHWAEVYHINLKAFSITKAYDIPKLAGAGAFATSTTDANVYFTRLTADETFVFSSASHGILGRWPIARHSVSGWPENARPIHAVSEVVAKADSAHAVRSAVLLSTGDWVLVRNGDVDWSRPEELASATAAVFAEIPAAKTLARELELESHKSVVGAFIHRTTRHLKDLEYAPAWLLSVPNRLLQALSGTTSTTQTHAPGKDRYGFRKVIVVATENGRLVGLDSTGGEIIWNTVVPGLSTGYKGKRPTLRVYSQGVVGVSDDSTANVQYVDVLKGNILSPGDPVISTLTQEQDPHDVSAQRVTVTFKLADGELLGFLASSKNDSPLWRFSPSHQERILSVVQRPLDDPVASIGRVLGDRRVLYKYLNPNVLVVTTVSDTKNTMSVHLVDAVSGATLYSVTHASVDTSRPMTSTISENWFAYTFSAASSTHQSRGTQLVVADLYESTLPNDRGPLGSSANYSSLDVTSTSGEIAKPHLISQSYHIPEEISYMTVTQTRQGITTRQLLVALPESKAIAGISRTIIDPRRPVGRDPTAAEASEGLIRYTPVLDIDARSYLTHKREVVGIKEIKTCPSSLESTGLVFAYGLDVFGTRVSPSSTFDVLGKEFNKLQMLATVAALAVGVTFVAPLVCICGY